MTYLDKCLIQRKGSQLIRLNFIPVEVNDGETIQYFGYALRRLVCMAYPKDHFDDTLERLAINQFMAGL